MASFDAPVKFEDSPAESLLSMPGDPYPSLFEPQPSTMDTMDPSQMMSPQSVPGTKDSTPVPAEGAEAEAEAEDDAGESPSSDKKTKKRKSWGQVLPEPKTNLPPRKRAKTEDEKEQRRVERVLRNRRAAQSSRERKRLEVEALETKNKDLEASLNHARQTNLALIEELKKFRRDSGARSTSPFDSFNSPVTLSRDLFATQEARRLSGDASAAPSSSLVDELINSTTQPSATVNPASLSPALSPAPEAEDEPTKDATEAPVAATAATPSDLTQRPAEMLCDLQCQSEEMSRPWAMTSQQQMMWAWLILSITKAAVYSACQKSLMQIALSLKAGFSLPLPPTRSITRTIIWLVTRPSSRWSSTSSSTFPSSSTTRPATRLSTRRTTLRNRSSAAASPLTLRLKSLQKILTCSPNLARPLMDATMEALRLVQSEGCETRGGGEEANGAVARDVRGEDDPRTWLNGNPLPSREVLLTLLWALKVEERKMRQGTSPLETSSVQHPHCQPESQTQTTQRPTDNVYLVTIKAPLLRKRKADHYTTIHGGKEKRFRSS